MSPPRTSAPARSNRSRSRRHRAFPTQEIQKLVKDAEAHAAEDKNARDLAEACNKADAAIYQVEKTLKDYGDKISPEEKNAITEAIAKANKAKELSDPVEIDKAIEELMQASHKMAEEMYKQTAGQAEGQPGPAPGQEAPKQEGQARKPDDGAMDADFEVVDDK